MSQGDLWIIDDLTFVTAPRQVINQRWYEAVKHTGPSSRHEFQVWTEDDGKTWNAKLHVRWSHNDGPIFTTHGEQDARDGVRKVRQAYREYAGKRFGEGRKR